MEIANRIETRTASKLIDHTPVECVFLAVLHQLFSRLSLCSLEIHCWPRIETERASVLLTSFWGLISPGMASFWVAVLACSLARPNNVLSALVGVYRTHMQFPFLCSLFIDLYVWQMNCWPDCCREFLIARVAALLLMGSVML